MKEPKYDIRRGRHRKRASRETREWNRDHLIPACPPWMDRETYLQLTLRRSELERS